MQNAECTFQSIFRHGKTFSRSNCRPHHGNHEGFVQVIARALAGKNRTAAYQKSQISRVAPFWLASQKAPKRTEYGVCLSEKEPKSKTAQI